MSRFVVMTPAVHGADGVSELSRLVVRALGGVGAVDLWAFRGGRPPGMDVPFWSADGSPVRFAARALLRAASGAADCTVVVTHLHLAPLALPIVARGARLVVFVVGVEAWRRLRARERRAFERADHVVAISHHSARRFLDANPAVRLRRPIAVCHPGIAADEAAVVRCAERGFALIVGRMWREERYKGHDRLIDVWPAVQARVPCARLVVAGDGDDRARLEERARAAGLGDAVRFTGLVSDAELRGLYAACECLVLPSANEGFGIAYLEAMRAARPCVALHGAADEILTDSVDGFVVDGDGSQLVDALARLLGDGDLAARMGAEARRTFVARFTDAAFADRLLSAIHTERCR